MGGVPWKLNLFMLTQKYRSESDLVIWLLFGFEEVIVKVTDRECPLAHMRTIGIALAWLAAYTDYGVIFIKSHNFFVIVKSLMDLIRFIYYLIMHGLMRAFVEEGSTSFWIYWYLSYIFWLKCSMPKIKI